MLSCPTPLMGRDIIFLFLSFHSTPLRIFPLILASEEPPCPLFDTHVSLYPLPDSFIDPQLWDVSSLLVNSLYSPNNILLQPYLLPMSCSKPYLLKTLTRLVTYHAMPSLIKVLSNPLIYPLIYLSCLS